MLLLFLKIKAQKVENNSPEISLIICFHNEEKNIDNLFEALANQTDQQFNLICVNDRSTDATAEKLKEKRSHFNAELIQIEATKEGWGTKKWALWNGLKLAKTDWVCITDADCKPDEHWIRNMKNQMSDDSDFVLGFSPYLIQDGFLNFIIRQETYQTAFLYLGTASAQIPYMAVARNLAYKKNKLMESEWPYKQVVSGDDDLLLQYLNTKKVKIELQSAVWSQPKTSWKDWIKQKRRHLSAGKKYKPLILIGLTLFHLNHVLIYLFLLLQNTNADLIYSFGALLTKNICIWTFMRTIFSRSQIQYSFVEHFFWDFFQIFYQIFISILGILPITKDWK